MINQENSYSLYLQWLSSAKEYYWGYGEVGTMTDYQWDELSRRLFKERGSLPIEDYPVIHDSRFTGASIYWLPKAEYPV